MLGWQTGYSRDSGGRLGGLEDIPRIRVVFKCFIFRATFPKKRSHHVLLLAMSPLLISV